MTGNKDNQFKRKLLSKKVVGSKNQKQRKQTKQTKEL